MLKVFNYEETFFFLIKFIYYYFFLILIYCFTLPINLGRYRKSVTCPCCIYVLPYRSAFTIIAGT